MREHEVTTDERAVRQPLLKATPELSGPQVQTAGAGHAPALDATTVLRLQHAAGNRGVASALEEDESPIHAVVGSAGRPLDPDVRADMEGRLGHDFTDVRIHTDQEAQDSARSVNARAYTVGHDIAFQRDAYQPSSEDGRRTLAHELTHVIQQRAGAVDGTPAPGGIRISDPSDRYEQEAAAAAERVISNRTPAAENPSPPHPAQLQSDDHLAAPTQRLDDDDLSDEQSLQSSNIQRQEDEDDSLED